jgi:hypothetical protein
MNSIYEQTKIDYKFSSYYKHFTNQRDPKYKANEFLLKSNAPSSYLGTKL